MLFYVQATLQNGDKTRTPTNFKTTLSTLKAPLTLPRTHKHQKLPKDTTTNTQIIHEPWHQCIDYENLPTIKNNQL